MMFRPMRRFGQQLPPEECEAILQSEKRGVLAVLGDDGYPYTVPLDFLYADGKIYFHGAHEGHKIDALARCDKASFCVTDGGEAREGDWALWFRSVVAFGRVRMLTDREETIALARALALKYYPTPDGVEEEIEKAGSRVRVLEMTVEHLTGKRVHEK